MGSLRKLNDAQYRWFRAATLTLGWLSVAFAPSPWWFLLPVWLFVLPQFFISDANKVDDLAPKEKVLAFSLAVAVLAGAFWAGNYLDGLFGRTVINEFIRSFWFVLPCWVISMFSVFWKRPATR